MKDKLDKGFWTHLILEVICKIRNSFSFIRLGHFRWLYQWAKRMDERKLS